MPAAWPHRVTVREGERVTSSVWDGWWVVRWGRRLTHFEADDAQRWNDASIQERRRTLHAFFESLKTKTE